MISRAGGDLEESWESGAFERAGKSKVAVGIRQIIIQAAAIPPGGGLGIACLFAPGPHLWSLVLLHLKQSRKLKL